MKVLVIGTSIAIVGFALIGLSGHLLAAYLFDTHPPIESRVIIEGMKWIGMAMAFAGVSAGLIGSLRLALNAIDQQAKT